MKRHTQSGQALTELAILSAVLVPLFLLIPVLAKYAHLRQATQQAARNAAWEATVVENHTWATLMDASWRDRQRNLLVDRHFGRADEVITSHAGTAPADAPVGNELMGTFSGETLLQRDGLELMPYGNGSAGHIAEALDTVTGIVEALPGSFPPNENGLVTAEVLVRPRDLKASDGSPATFLAPFDALGLEFRASHTVFADGWGAAGGGLSGSPSAGHDRSVYEQVRAFVPTSVLSGLNEMLDDVGFLENIPLLGVPLRMRPGYLQPDIVPVHRLEAYEH